MINYDLTKKLTNNYVKNSRLQSKQKKTKTTLRITKKNFQSAKLPH